MSTPCVDTYKTVTLVPGEQFNLPPGAELIGSSNINSISSTCPPPSNLEQLACYGMVISDSDPDGGATPNYDDVTITGIEFNGVNIPFPAPFNFNSEVSAVYTFPATFTPLDSIIKANVEALLGDIFGTFAIQLSQDAGYGSTIWYGFQMLPSIAENLNITAVANVGWAGGGFSQVYINFPVKPLSEIDTLGKFDINTLCSTT